MEGLLKELARMSQTVGKRVDYIQGGGGNTSVKLDGGLIAVKASGLKLRQVTEAHGFAVVERDTLKDVTAEQGFTPLRPSVETGLHALLEGRFVLHTHPVYANAVLCSKGGALRLPDIMRGIEYITVPYRNPGSELLASVKERLRPGVRAILMENHGVAVTADSADEALRVHELINARCAESYGTTRAEFDEFYAAACKTLYPDQSAYLDLTDDRREIMAAVMFIHHTLRNNREEARAIPPESLARMANDESTKYRKTVLMGDAHTQDNCQLSIVNCQLLVSPRARALAEKNGVDASLAANTGPEGRVIERDVRDLMIKNAPAPFWVL
ncbi:MAG: class II aldolase/adducin family protein [Oscillospiraceae bacterium]|nr:class II aldolase/adducin family protein [Oscillospiraceae bacterium]